MKKSRFTAFTAITMPIIIVVAATVFVSPNNMIRRLALVSCALAMPESGFNEVSEWFLNADTSGTFTENAGVKSAASEITQSENATTVEKTVKLTAIPDDIAALMAKYQASAADDKKDGTITEYTYGKKDSTSTFKNIYVRNTTATKSINIEKVLNETLDLKIDKAKPAVLIVHTHTTEGYEILDRGWYAQNYISRSKNESVNVARVGDEIAEQLTNAGYIVIHDKTIHDSTYSGAYNRSRATIQKYLDKYPNIQIVLDVHRDAIQLDNGVKMKPTAVINGKKVAQIMIITGAQEKAIKNYPNWEYNLRFAVKLQKTAEDLYPGLMRPVFFCTRKYNMDMTKCSLLLEMGSDVNTLDEAAYSGRLIGSALATLMSDYISK